MPEEVQAGTYHNGYEIRATQNWWLEVLDDKGNVVHSSPGGRSYEEALAAGRGIIDQALPPLGQDR